MDARLRDAIPDGRSLGRFVAALMRSLMELSHEVHHRARRGVEREFQADAAGVLAGIRRSFGQNPSTMNSDSPIASAMRRRSFFVAMVEASSSVLRDDARRSSVLDPAIAGHRCRVPVAVDRPRRGGLRRTTRDSLYPRSYPQAGRDPPEPAGAHRNNRTQSDPAGPFLRFRYAVPTHHNIWWSHAALTSRCWGPPGRSADRQE